MANRFVPYRFEPTSPTASSQTLTPATSYQRLPTASSQTLTPAASYQRLPTASSPTLTPVASRRCLPTASSPTTSARNVSYAGATVSIPMTASRSQPALDSKLLAVQNPKPVMPVRGPSPSATHVSHAGAAAYTPMTSVRSQPAIGNKLLPVQIPKPVTPVRASMPARVLYTSPGTSGNPVRIAGRVEPPASPTTAQKAARIEEMATAVVVLPEEAGTAAVVLPAPVAAEEKAAVSKAGGVCLHRVLRLQMKPGILRSIPGSISDETKDAMLKLPGLLHFDFFVPSDEELVVHCRYDGESGLKASEAKVEDVLKVIAACSVGTVQRLSATGGMVTPAGVKVWSLRGIAAPVAMMAVKAKPAEAELKVGNVALHRLLRVPLMPGTISKIPASISGETKDGLLKLDGLLDFDLFASSGEELVAYCCYTGEAGLKASGEKVADVLKLITACSAGEVQQLSATGGMVAPAGVKVWSLRGIAAPLAMMVVEQKPAEAELKVGSVALHRLLCVPLMPRVLSQIPALINGERKEGLLKLDGLLDFDLFASSGEELVAHICVQGDAGLKESEAQVEDVLKVITACSAGDVQRLSATGGMVTPAGVKVWSLRGAVAPQAMAALEEKPTEAVSKARTIVLHRLLRVPIVPTILSEILASISSDSREGLLKLEGLLDFDLHASSGEELVAHGCFDGEAGLKASEAKVADVLKSITACAAGTVQQLSATGGMVTPAGVKVWSLRGIAAPLAMMAVEEKPAEAELKVGNVALHCLLRVPLMPGILSQTPKFISEERKEGLLKLDGLLEFDLFASAEELVAHCCYDGEAGLKASEAQVEDVLKVITACAAGTVQRLSATGGMVTPAGVKAWSLRGTSVRAKELFAEKKNAEGPTAPSPIGEKPAEAGFKGNPANLHRLLCVQNKPGTLLMFVASMTADTKQGLLNLRGLLDFDLYATSGEELVAQKNPTISPSGQRLQTATPMVVAHCRFDGEAGLKASEAQVEDVLTSLTNAAGNAQRFSATGGMVTPAGEKVWSLRRASAADEQRRKSFRRRKSSLKKPFVEKTTSPCCISLTAVSSMLKQKKPSSQQDMTSMDKAVGA